MPTFALPAMDYLYVIASMIVAIGILIQGWFLYKNQGKLPNLPLFHLLSLLESCWVLVSGLALYFLDFDNLAICVPVVYLAYTLLGFFYASKTMSSKEAPPTTLDEIVIDTRYISFCQSFAVVYLGLCGATLYFSFGLLPN